LDVFEAEVLDGGGHAVEEHEEESCFQRHCDELDQVPCD
jgi:hypothetical protein